MPMVAGVGEEGTNRQSTGSFTALTLLWRCCNGGPMSLYLCPNPQAAQEKERTPTSTMGFRWWCSASAGVDGVLEFRNSAFCSIFL
jgi:hypothetical protein